MSKNLTRKGLALGAIVALGSSLFAGAPASAAASLSVVPDSGTGFTVLASDTFKVRTLGVDYSLSSTSELQYKITKPSSSATVSYTLSNHNTSYGSDTPVSVISTGAVDYIKSGATSTVGSRPALLISPTINSVDASQDYVVQAFIESGNTAGLDANDTVISTPVTVHFVKSIVPTVAVDKVSAGQKVTGTVSYGADFNYAQATTTTTRVLFSDQGGSFDAASVEVTRNTAETGFEFESATTSAPAVAVSDVIGVKARSKGYDDDATYTFSAVVYSTADAANSATAVDTTITRGDNIALAASSTAVVVRAGTKSFTYRVDFTKASGVQSVGSGQSVQIITTELTDTIGVGDVVTVNGKALTGTATSTQSATLNTVTDADGGVTITVASAAGTATDAVRIQVKATGTLYESDYKFTWTTAALAKMTETNTVLNAVTQTIVRGSSVTVNYALRDQFGGLWTKTGTDYQVYAVASSGTLVLTQTAQFAAGVATLTFTDNSTSAGTPTLTSKLKLKTTGDYSWATAENATTETTVRPFNVVTAAQAAASITANEAKTGTTWASTASSAAGVADTAVSRSTVRLGAIDLRSNSNGLGLSVVTGDGVKVSGTVLNADGSAAAGVPVTVAATGLYFSDDATGSTYVSANSITVNTTVTGTYVVYAFSQKGGSATITTTSGAVVKSQKVTFKAAAANSGTKLTVSAPAETLAGRAVNVVIALTDKFGAPVTTATTTSPISVTLSGVGYPTTIAANTDEDGLISFKLVLGADETGVATITAKYDGDGTGTDYLPITTVATVNVVKALTAAGTAAVAGSTGKFYVSATAAAGKLVVVKVAGKFVTSFKATGSKKSVAVKSSKGSKKVTVFVGGKLAATKTVTVK